MKFSNVLRIIVCIFLTLKQLDTFQVKVLLKRLTVADNKQEVVLHSPYGFIISPHAVLSYGKELGQKHCSIAYQDKVILCNNEQAAYKLSYVTPRLSGACKDKLEQLVQFWMRDNATDIESEIGRLSEFFSQFVQKASNVSDITFDELEQVVMYIFDQFFIATFKQLQDPAISYEMLKDHAELFFKGQIRYEFLKELGLKKLTKKDRKLITQNQKQRNTLFTQVIASVIKTLLVQFLQAAPRAYIAQLTREPIAGLRFEGNEYLGSFALLEENNTFYLINVVDIDDYLLSVIRHEGWPGWPLEANKVLAVACRTYLVWQVLQAQKTKRPYHIENGIRHQSYKGHHKYDRLKQAISDTKDLCLAYDGKPILAMFDACCGGVIPAKINEPGYKPYGYLMRSQPCTYCKGSKAASWITEIPYEKMLEVLQSEFPSIQNIVSMKVTAKDEAGRVEKIMISSTDSSVILSGKKLYSFFPGVKSFCFDIQTVAKHELFHKKTEQNQSKKKKNIARHKEPMDIEDKKFIVYGVGYGHHMGLCQWGAMKLVKDHHWNYQNILKFYYPDTSLIKLTYQR